MVKKSGLRSGVTRIRPCNPCRHRSPISYRSDLGHFPCACCLDHPDRRISLALYSQHSQWDQTLRRSDLVAFDFAARGNLAAWFSSMSLVLSTVLMLAIYSVRQHRLDDYRGRFTIWLWAAGWAAFCSLDATAGLHHAVRGICVVLSGTAVHGDGSIWWVFVYSVVFGFLAVRLMVEMQPSRIALASLLTSVLSYAISALVLLELVPTLVGRLATIAHVTSLMLGHLLLVFSLLTHARYVMMDALGKTRPRPRRTAATSKKATDDQTQTGETSVKADKKASQQPETKRPMQTESKPPCGRIEKPGYYRSAVVRKVDASRRTQTGA